MATSNSIITQRRHDLDNLRTFLTGLVVAHHTAIVYGGAGSGPFRSALIPNDAHQTVPLLFNAFNQSFFMGTFFWISGLVSAQSVARAKGSGHSPWKFIKAKAQRLLLPAVINTVILVPMTSIVCMKDRTYDTVTAYLYGYFSTLRGIRGAAWYPATLFIFDVVAAAVTYSGAEFGNKMTTFEKKENKIRRARTWGRWGWIGVAAACFFTRLYYPCGISVPPLGLQPGYLPQYIFAYAMGHLSYYENDKFLPGLLSSTDSTGPGSFIGVSTASVVSGALFTVCTLPYIWHDANNWMPRMLSQMMGGWNIGAACYALWNELSFSLVAPAIVNTFYEYYNKPVLDSSSLQPRYSYVAFLIHSLVFSITAVGLDTALVPARQHTSWTSSYLWKLVGPVALTCIMSKVNIETSFRLGKYLLQCFPGLATIV